MKTYTKEEKTKAGKWIQKHLDMDGITTIYKIHYIENDTEYSVGRYSTAKEARAELKKF